MLKTIVGSTPSGARPTPLPAALLAGYVLVLSAAPGLAFSGAGSGTSEDPYRIMTCGELQEMADALHAAYVLANDLDCSETRSWNDGAGFAPVGGDVPFTGTFDGQGHTIRGLYIYRPDRTAGYDVGLFGYAESAELRNATLEDFEVTGYVHVGSLVGTLRDGGEIFGVTVLSPTISGRWAVGGVAGDGVQTRISQATVSGVGSIRGESGVGGVVGGMDGLLSDCHASVEVIGEMDLGGLAGYVDDWGYYDNGEWKESLVERCSASGDVTGTQGDGVLIGGLVGWTVAHYRHSQATGTVRLPAVPGQDGLCVGGLVGYFDAHDGQVIDRSWATGDVIVPDGEEVGGFLGCNQSRGLIRDSYATGAVVVNESRGGVGGFVGENLGEIFNSYATGEVTGADEVGGFAGFTDASILSSFSTGGLTALGSWAGGFAGAAWGWGNWPPTPEESYWLDHGASLPCLGDQVHPCDAPPYRQSDLTYFYNVANPPMSNWDFDCVWSRDNDGTALPTLRPLDFDCDGFGPEEDCDDDVASTYPGAPEVRHDGIDQDCNGHDLTIEILRADYDAKKDSLIVVATSAHGVAAALELLGWGTMGWRPSGETWEISVTAVGGDPGTVTVCGFEGCFTAGTVTYDFELHQFAFVDDLGNLLDPPGEEQTLEGVLPGDTLHLRLAFTDNGTAVEGASVRVRYYGSFSDFVNDSGYRYVRDAGQGGDWEWAGRCVAGDWCEHGAPLPAAVTSDHAVQPGFAFERDFSGFGWTPSGNSSGCENNLSLRYTGPANVIRQYWFRYEVNGITLPFSPMHYGLNKGPMARTIPAYDFEQHQFAFADESGNLLLPPGEESTLVGIKPYQPLHLRLVFTDHGTGVDNATLRLKYYTSFTDFENDTNGSYVTASSAWSRWVYWEACATGIWCDHGTPLAAAVTSDHNPRPGWAFEADPSPFTWSPLGTSSGSENNFSLRYQGYSLGVSQYWFRYEINGEVIPLSPMHYGGQKNWPMVQTEELTFDFEQQAYAFADDQGNLLDPPGEAKALEGIAPYDTLHLRLAFADHGTSVANAVVRLKYYTSLEDFENDTHAGIVSTVAYSGQDWIYANTCPTGSWCDHGTPLTTTLTLGSKTRPGYAFESLPALTWTSDGQRSGAENNFHLQYVGTSSEAREYWFRYEIDGVLLPYSNKHYGAHRGPMVRTEP